eukprot:TRINITY_DN1423_c0_g1_i2.p1 TRINITY_DN1423_c0_g1~~TRINITY_DN1423_c0_g1_i2.p1  ORF type:complete len:356 (+),score=52.79 TRINITY_DN1423_c0_g1_i2:817-1884(+)
MPPKRERALEDPEALPDAKRQKQMEYSNESSSTTEPRSPNGMKLSGPPLSPAAYPPMPLQHAYAAAPYGMYPTSVSPSPASSGPQYAQGGHPSWLGAQQGRFPSPVPGQHFTSQPPHSNSLISPMAAPVPTHAQQYQYAAPPQYPAHSAMAKQTGFPSHMPSNAVFPPHQQQYQMHPQAHAQYGDLHGRHAMGGGAWMNPEQEMSHQSYQQWASQAAYGQHGYPPNKMYGAPAGFPQYAHHPHHQSPMGVAPAMAGGFPRVASSGDTAEQATTGLSNAVFPRSASASPTTMVSENSPRPGSAPSSSVDETGTKKSPGPSSALSTSAAPSAAPASMVSAAPLSSVSLPSFQELAAQ